MQSKMKGGKEGGKEGYLKMRLVIVKGGGDEAKVFKAIARYNKHN